MNVLAHHTARRAPMSSKVGNPRAWFLHMSRAPEPTFLMNTPRKKQRTNPITNATWVNQTHRGQHNTTTATPTTTRTAATTTNKTNKRHPGFGRELSSLHMSASGHLIGFVVFPVHMGASGHMNALGFLKGSLVFAYENIWASEGICRACICAHQGIWMHPVHPKRSRAEQVQYMC